MLVCSVAMNSLLVTPEWLDHAPWASVHPIDLVFPVFVTLSGCGLGFALGRGVGFGELARRTAVLLAAGLLYNAIVSASWNLDTWRVTGVLQTYAMVVVVIGLLHLLTRGWRGWAAITGLFAVAHTVLLAGWAERCVGGVLTRECNPSGAIDTLVFTADHIYQLGAGGHDPEGLVALLGTLVSASAGATVGHLLLSVRRRALARSAGVGAAVLPLVALAAAFLAAAFVLTWAPTLVGARPVPMMKRLWSPPFALALAAATTIALLLGHLLVDRAGTGRVLRGLSYPILALGRNSLLVYFGSHVLMGLLSRPLPDGTVPAETIAATIAVAGHVQATWTAALLLFWILLTSLLHRHRLYLRP